MAKLNYWTDKWDLHVDICPCDVHVNDWLAEQKATNRLIYHFGTGTHHVVGKEQAENGSGNMVFGITASNLPRSTITSERSKRRTVPETISPARSLNSS